MYSLAQAVVCRVLVPVQVYSNLHLWSVFFPKAVAHILNACIVICAVVVEVVAVVVVVVGRNIVTCTV